MEYLETLNPVETIQYSSFLNLVCQTAETDEIINIVNRELATAKLSARPVRNLLFHRDNILHLIATVLESCTNGTGNITGGRNPIHPQRYYKSLMLISNKLSMKTADATKNILRDHFIRDYPYYYSSNTSLTIYSRRLRRYWYIYSELLPAVDKNQGDKIEEGLTAVEKSAGVSLKEYFQVIREMLMWCLEFPVIKREGGGQRKLPELGFDYRNINSFYIRRNSFKKYSAFLKVVEHLAMDIEELKKKIKVPRRDEIPGFFRHFQTFFDHPFFRVDKDTFCLIDLRFALEGVCAGFLWQVHRIAEKDIRQLKDQYGYLLERYFSFVLEKTFPSITLTGADEGKPDAVLDLSEAIIIFEFTTEYYRFSSLYSTSYENFEGDLHRLLLNEGKDDGLGRGKKDVGKLVKINTYMENLGTQKRIIPVLITENILGDYDLLDQFDGIVSKGISEHGLKHLQTAKPLIINLDDLETCWGLLKNSDSGRQFVTAIDEWNKTDKGPYHYNFMYFLTNYFDGKIVNDGYREFFNRDYLLEHQGSDH